MNIDYGTQTIEISVIRSNKVKNCYITVQRESGVLVKVPENMPEDQIKTLVRAKAKWIVQKKAKLGKVVMHGEIVSGSRLFYLGKSYYVEVVLQHRKDVVVEFIHSKFKIFAPKNVTQAALREAVVMFYKKKAKLKIEKLVKKYSKKMQLFPEYIGFKESRTKWASCSPRNRLSFNPEVMKLASSLIEYVVVHELAHIAHKNHSKEFWKLVAKFMGDYKDKEEKLREFEKKI